jgi:hypothetical protein
MERPGPWRNRSISPNGARNHEGSTVSPALAMTSVTRPEFDALAARVDRMGDKTAEAAVSLASALTKLDGVAEDVAEIKTGLADRDRAHVVGRRWAVGICLAGLAAVGGLYPLVAMLAEHH